MAHGIRTAAVLALLALLSPEPTRAAGSWRLLPEMAEPDGVVVDEAPAREALTASAEGIEAMARVEAAIADEWRQLQGIDWPALSRYQIEATEGWTVPEAPGVLVSRVLGRDSRGRLQVETRGPRLPARFDIVYRYVYVFGIYDPLTGGVGEFVATIRGWIEE